MNCQQHSLRICRGMGSTHKKKKIPCEAAGDLNTTLMKCADNSKQDKKVNR